MGSPAYEKPTLDEVREWLGDVPDPEIPVISVVDLGIVRDVEWRGDELIITVTPTYSGCPATSVIAFDISEAMRARGVQNVVVETRLSPAWTTDWITKEAREKLLGYGIAPPEEGGACPVGQTNAGSPAACPHCGSNSVERISQFGSTPCKAQYRCKDCLEPFDYFKRY